MMIKRKAAAEIFNTQQENNQAEELLAADLDDAFSMPAAAKVVGEAQTYRSAEPKMSKPPMSPSPQSNATSQLVTSEELQLAKEPLKVRETGFGLWKRVIVPPNAYVVHTRLGRQKPVTTGLGVSFSYNPYRDAYLIVPAAMQTIGVVANCITREKQGINILAYLQWQIDDFATAYRRLDFSDSHDPLGIVNAQLREQAEAAIKDKIATMSVEEVLTDKAPVIEELTTRLKAVAEGRQEKGDEGLGIKIVTVQIREALVSSQRLWQDLQAPFRNEQAKNARISQLLTQQQIKQKELETNQLTETSEAETRFEIERIKQNKQTEITELRLTEESKRFSREQTAAQEKLRHQEETETTKQASQQRLNNQKAEIEQTQHLSQLQREHAKQLEESKLVNQAKQHAQTLETEQALHELQENQRFKFSQLEAEQKRLEQELVLQQQQAAFNLEVQKLADALQAAKQTADLERQQQVHQFNLTEQEAEQRLKLAEQREEVEILRLQQEIRNQISQADLLNRLFAQLPAIAEHLPEVHELKVLQTQGDGGFDTLAALVTKTVALMEQLGTINPSSTK